MKPFIDPELIGRTYRDPLALMSLAVDLFPIAAVLLFGWQAVPLVALSWLENLVIGGFTLLRIIGTAAGNISHLGLVLFMVPFFTFHYGMFCFVHGIFLRSFSGSGQFPDSPAELVGWALGTGPHMAWFVGAIIAVNAVFYVVDYLIGGAYRTAVPSEEMMAPYGRIVTLHVAILFGAGIMIALGQPLLGVLILIFLRVAFGVALNLLRRRRIEGTAGRILGAIAEAR